jgi:hypothetical protein
MTPTEREFFPRVRKTIIPRPAAHAETDVLGQSGSVRAAAATIYGPNWYHDPHEDLIEIWDAGPALCFKDVLPRKDKYAREGLYLRLSLAYRTTANAFVNIRTFSGNNVTLPNAIEGAMYDDPYTRFYVTDDCTLNINSIYREERLWLQRVDWEWVSRETIFEDELSSGNLYLERAREEVEALYAPKEINDDTVKGFLIDKIRTDPVFAKRCLLLLAEEGWLRKDLVALYEMNYGSDQPKKDKTDTPRRAGRRRRTDTP